MDWGVPESQNVLLGSLLMTRVLLFDDITCGSMTPREGDLEVTRGRYVLHTPRPCPSYVSPVESDVERSRTFPLLPCTDRKLCVGSGGTLVSSGWFTSSRPPLPPPSCVFFVRVVLAPNIHGVLFTLY